MWPFAGRAAEFERLMAALADPRAGGMAITGPPGVGKSRLVYEALAALDPDRFAVHSVPATSANSDVPFGALGVLVPDGVGGVVSWGVLVRATTDALAAGPRRAVVVVDDAHLLDDDSAAVLRHLARTRAAFALVVLRDGERFSDWLAALWTEGLADRIELAALPAADVGRVLHEVLRGQVAELTVRRLHELTGGNPLLMREVVLAGLQVGALAATKGVWRWNGPWLVAPRLTDLVSRRLGELDADERWALELLALAEPVSIGVVTRIVPEDLLSRLESRGLLWIQRDGRRSLLRLAHPLYGEALRDACPTLRTRKAKRVLAEAIAATGARRRSDALRIARWSLDAGVKPPAGMLLAATRRAWTLLDVPLAEQLARAATEAAMTSGDAALGMVAAQTLWRVLISGERTAELMALLDGMSALATTGPQHAKISFGRAETLFWGLGDAAAHRALPDPADVSDRDHAEELVALRAVFAAFMGDLGAAVAELPALFAAGISNEEAGAKAGLVRELIVAYGGHQALTGSRVARHPEPVDAAPRLDPAEAARHPVDTAPRTEPAEAARNMPWITPTTVLFQVQAALLDGRPDLAARLAEREHEAALAHGWEYALMVSSIARALVARFTGAVEEARRWLREAVVLHQRDTVTGRLLHRLLYGEVAHTEALAGDADAARRALRTADALEWAPATLFGLWADLGRPWVAATGGDRRAAGELAYATAERAGTMGAAAIHALALTDAVRLGFPAAAGAIPLGLAAADAVRPGSPAAAEAVRRDPAGSAGTAGPLGAADDGGDLLDPPGSPYLRYAAAIIAADAAALEAAARDFGRLGLHPLAAEGYGRAARCHQERGRAHSARRCSGMSAEHLRRCHGLARSDLLPAAAELTARERAVAELVLTGLTHRQVADRLGIAKRTVDNHVSRAYAKLGVTNRDELRDVLRP
ncbi:MAG TPA: LuxR C-terminal-related transcriptional regulator [Nonomuraea sp.]|nr:LuxR C-terminal-related transcriptional regulator [Nonomuraea sp.]